MHASNEASPISLSLLSFVWLEITGKCNLHCAHCYADSAPRNPQGSLSCADWETVIADAKAMGVKTVQFIGGEPTLHPNFEELAAFAAGADLFVEVYTNLLRIPQRLWDLFEEHHIALATSFYSAQPESHDRVTERKGSQQRTLSNIQEAMKRSLPLRVGIIRVYPDQDVARAEQFLRALGVKNVGVDDTRSIGHWWYTASWIRPLSRANRMLRRLRTSAGASRHS